MASQTCAYCGKTKDVFGGKTCDNGHFVCKDCYRASANVKCRLCGTRLK